MNRIIQRRGSRTVAAMALTCVLVLIALFMLSLAPSGLVRTARAAPPAPDANRQIAELYMLQAGFHEALSFNTDAQVTADHLELMGDLFANDATLTILASGAHFQGRAAIRAFFATTPQFNSDLVSLSPTFRTKFDQDGETAAVYFECHVVNPSTDVVVAHRFVQGTAKKIKGHWFFQDVEVGVATL